MSEEVRNFKEVFDKRSIIIDARVDSFANGYRDVLVNEFERGFELGNIEGLKEGKNVGAKESYTNGFARGYHSGVEVGLETAKMQCPYLQFINFIKGIWRDLRWSISGK